jgi:hypothetical protein
MKRAALTPTWGTLQGSSIAYVLGGALSRYEGEERRRMTRHRLRAVPLLGRGRWVGDAVSLYLRALSN